MFIIICLGSQYPPLLWEQYSLFSGRDSSKEKHRCRLSFILLCVFYFCPRIILKEVFVSLDQLWAVHRDGGGSTAQSCHITAILSRFVPRACIIIINIILKGLFFHSSRALHVPLAHVRCLPAIPRPFTDACILGQILFLAITTSVRRNPTELARG